MARGTMAEDVVSITGVPTSVRYSAVNQPMISHIYVLFRSCTAVKHARDFSDADFFGKQGPYVLVSVGDQESRSQPASGAPLRTAPCLSSMGRCCAWSIRGTLGSPMAL